MLEKKWASIEDFATIFQYLWYQDFPISREGAIGARAVDWTKHIDKIISNIAGFIGFVTRFEAGGRTDAVLRSTNGNEVAIEWEWGKNWDTEINKLKEHKKMWPKSKQALKYAVFITYTEEVKNSCEKIANKWKYARWPLLLIIITSNKVSKTVYSSGRGFLDIQMYRFDKEHESGELLRKAPALPWNVEGTRWSYEIK